MLLRYFILIPFQNLWVGFSVGHWDLFRKDKSGEEHCFAEMCCRWTWFCSFIIVSQLCRRTVNLYTYTFVHVVVIVLQLYINTLNTRTDTHMQTHFFSQAKTPAVYFVTETENHNANNMHKALVWTACLIIDKGKDTILLSIHLSTFSFFPPIF